MNNSSKTKSQRVINQATKMAAEKVNRESMTQPTHEPIESHSQPLPRFGVIYNHEILSHPMQITRDVVHYWSQQVWNERFNNSLEQSQFMPRNWVGIYVVSALLDRMIREGLKPIDSPTP